jgi:hypothetical protein
MSANSGTKYRRATNEAEFLGFRRGRALVLILRGLGQLLLFLTGNGLAVFGLVFLSRRLRRAFTERARGDAECAKPMTSGSPVDTGLSVPDFSPVLVRDTPKPKSRSGQGASPSIFFLLLSSVCMSLMPAPTHAQETNPTITLPPLHVDAPAASCVDVEVDGARQPAFDCLNEQLKATAEGAVPSDPNTALNLVVGKAEPNKVGTFSHTGESIRMGSNFGKSAFPQRPPAPAYGNALTAGVKP